MTKASLSKNQQRTAVIYFGSERETYLYLVQALDSTAFLQFIQQPLQAQLGSDMEVVVRQNHCPVTMTYNIS